MNNNKIDEFLEFETFINQLKIRNDKYIYVNKLVKYIPLVKRLFDLYYIDVELYRRLDKNQLVQVIQSSKFSKSHVANQRLPIFNLSLNNLIDFVENDFEEMSITINLVKKSNREILKISKTYSSEQFKELNNSKAKSIGVDFIFVIKNEMELLFINIFKKYLGYGKK